jgi:hypothetical protein
VLCGYIPFVFGAVDGVHYLKLLPHQFRFFFAELILFLS